MPHDCAVDTNVLVTANEEAPQASPCCVLASIQRLREIRDEARVVIDSLGEIFAEYRQYCVGSGQPGAGDAFFKWVWDNQANPVHVVVAPLTRHGDRGYAEFPEDEGLAGFDFNDRKFVACLVAIGSSGPLINAVDSDYSMFATELHSRGIIVDELCLNSGSD